MTEADPTQLLADLARCEDYASAVIADGDSVERMAAARLVLAIRPLLDRVAELEGERDAMRTGLARVAQALQKHGCPGKTWREWLSVADGLHVDPYTVDSCHGPVARKESGS
jgi:hypothetical protein